ncbi:MAG: hypothetical protein M1832_003513 [Thelocarpon impressellum]|nr:MAG: hypothetical protein M1832_003513 [Thelocarpon impressellum]
MLVQGITSLALTVLLGTGVSGRAALGRRQVLVSEGSPSSIGLASSAPLATVVPLKPSSGVNASTLFVLQLEYIDDGSNRTTTFADLPLAFVDVLDGALNAHAPDKSSSASPTPSADSARPEEPASSAPPTQWGFDARAGQAMKFTLTEDDRITFHDGRLSIIADLDGHQLLVLPKGAAVPTNAVTKWKFDSYDNLLAYDGREPQWRLCRNTLDASGAYPPNIVLAGGDDSNRQCQNIHLRYVRSETQYDKMVRAYPGGWSAGAIPPARNRSS